jgi:hypothetical protein
MNGLIARIRVLGTAVNTWLVAAALIAPIIIGEVAEELPSDKAEVFTKWGSKVVSWIGAAIAIVRRSTPVIKSQRGLLAPEPGTPVVPMANVTGDNAHAG